MPLFEYDPEGFELHSGGKSNRRIDCSWLSDADLYSLASSYADNQSNRFRWIVPVMRGGLRFANILAPMVYDANSKSKYVLIVDDVWTTGESVKDAVKCFGGVCECHAVVIFARSPTPDSVTVASDPWLKEAK